MGELSIVDKRLVIRLLVEPRVHRVGDDQRGKRDINRNRVTFHWR